MEYSTNPDEYKESEWNLSRELERIYASQIRIMADYSFKVTNGQTEYLRPLYAIFKQLWFEWRPRVLSKEKKTKYDNAFNRINELLKLFLTGKNTKNDYTELINKIDEFHKKLIALMGLIGLDMINKEKEDEDEENENNEELIKINDQRKKVEQIRRQFTYKLQNLKTNKPETINELKKVKKELLKEEKELLKLEKSYRIGVYSDL